ncbi:hypothetical protein B7463_g1514, partial [Scytalidium lignicola]
MDLTIQRLRDLIGEDDIWEDHSQIKPPTSPVPSAKGPSEKTESSDDEVITRNVIPPKDESGELVHGSHTATKSVSIHSPTRKYQLQMGELAEDTERFCIWQTIKRYPYEFVGTANRERVSQGFFEAAKVYQREWDLFYLYRPHGYGGLGPIILVPTEQFEHFLQTINNELGTALKIPTGGASPRFEVVFDDEGIPRPRYLGNLHNQMPAKKSKKEKKEAARIKKEKSLKYTVDKVRQYLGLLNIGPNIRDVDDVDEYIPMIPSPYDSITASFDLLNITPLEQESVIFICVDVEAWERNLSVITEVGIATLDTEDLKSIPPGENGTNWRNAIRARHFRISEHRDYNNSQFVSGCADRFMFGDSEFVRLSDTPHIISTCFKPPYSKVAGTAEDAENQPKRNIVLVGHDVGADIGFLKKIGYDLTNLSNLTEVVDTAKMWQYHKQENQARSLGVILAELDIRGWNLHNAGNDAVYTLQAMLGIAIQAAVVGEQHPEEKKVEEALNDKPSEGEINVKLSRAVISNPERSESATPAVPVEAQSNPPESGLYETSSEDSSSTGGVPIVNLENQSSQE